jgi:hypothetical protein
MTEMRSDLLWGIKAIAAAIGQSPRQVHYMLTRGQLPAGQQGERWVASKRVLQAHFSRLTSEKARTAAIHNK